MLILQLQVIGSMAMVRNSVGSECYVADEIITSRAGVRIRVGNTDAEGRMAMADVLCLMKEKAIKEVGTGEAPVAEAVREKQQRIWMT